jgi:glycosyltransferase involved in cell wall biosynthesis
MVRVLRAHPALRWFIAGGASIWEHDAYRAEFRANVDLLETDVRSRVVQLGPMPERELTVLYEMSQILLCPSLQEGFGLCVLEAMAAGTAVVVSNREPFTEYLAQHEACFVEPESPFSIAEAVERLCSDAELCATLAKAGRARVEEFSWERVAALHERLYRSVLPSTASFAHVYEEPAHA